MKIDLLYDLSPPNPGHDHEPARIFAEAIEQIQLADHVGFDEVPRIRDLTPSPDEGVMS